MKILLAIDGSEFSNAAVKQCCNLLSIREDAEIRILSAAESAFTSMKPLDVPAGYVHEIDAAALKKANEVVTDAESKIRQALSVPSVRLTTKVVQLPPRRAIVDEAQEWGADLIVIGSHGYGFWHRALLGSVSTGVVHHAPCSVLVVRMREPRGRS